MLWFITPQEQSSGIYLNDLNLETAQARKNRRVRLRKLRRRNA